MQPIMPPSLLPRVYKLIPIHLIRSRLGAVHVIGEIAGALGFHKNNLYARYELVSNEEHWHVMEGSNKGYTHVDETAVSRTVQLLVLIPTQV